MSDTDSMPDDNLGGAEDSGSDRDSQPSLNAPEEGRPDGLTALDDDDSESTGGDGTPS